MKRKDIKSPAKPGTRTQEEVAAAVEKVKILRLVDHPSHNGQVWSVIEMLKTCIENLQIKDEDDNLIHDYGKAIVLFLDDSGDSYITSFAQAKMNRVDIITLLETMKVKFVQRLLEEENETL